MPDRADWHVPKEILGEVVLSPKYKRMSGRPRKGRRKSIGEKISIRTKYFNRCGHEGHNRRLCTFFFEKNE